MTKEFMRLFRENIEHINNSNDIRVVLLMSSSPGYFCSGANLKERATFTEEETRKFVIKARETFQDFAELKVPTICGIDGFAFGGGLELALTCDIRIATKNALIGLTECGLGIIPGAGGSQRLPRLIGVNKAKELMFTCEKLTGEQCLNLGIVNHVVEKYENLEEKALEMAKRILKCGPIAIQAVKKAIDEGIHLDLRSALGVEMKNYDKVLSTEDRLEGIKAFLEKREPQYKGK
jgi:methylglutaconyl-CoA hydratase